MRASKVQYRDVDYAETRCRHLVPIRSLAVRTEAWQRLRGTAVTIDLDSFEAGACATCDTWQIAASEHVVVRGAVEVAD